MKNFWDERYSTPDYVYGTLPNSFLKRFIDNNPPASIFFPCEGEGRNAVYAAKNGWSVYAVDFSETARNKAMALAEVNRTRIEYKLANIGNWDENIEFDAIALIYSHLPTETRKKIHARLANRLKPGGTIIMEAFSKNQLNYTSGGPKDPSLLYDKKMLIDDFNDFTMEFLSEEVVHLTEGSLHKGEASVIQMIAKKKTA